MDRQVLEQRLLQAERNASLGFEVIAEQRQIVAGLDTWGLNSIAARRMLQVFEAMQERLLDDLEAAQVQLDAENQIRRRGT